MPKVSVQLSDEVHAAVRVRAFRDGVTLDGLGRAFFEGYAKDGLAAEDQPGEGSRPKGSGAAPWATRDDSTAPVMSSASPPAPAAKPCSRNARHHINHGGNPCPECGWPDTADWKKGKK